MEIATIINQDIKNAMRAKDVLKLETLRSIKTAFTNLEKETGSTEAEIPQAAYFNKLRSLVKQRNASADVYLKNGASAAAAKELAEASIIEAYLPKQLSAKEIESIITSVCFEQKLELTKSNMGKIIKEVGFKTDGQADGKTVAEIVSRFIREAAL